MSTGNHEKRVFWFDDNKTPNAVDYLVNEKDFVVNRLDFHGPEAGNWAVMEACHAYCITSARDEIPDQYKGTQALIERCKSLLVILASGAGYDPVDVAACTEAGVLVVNQSGGNAQAVAEHVVAMVLSLAKNILQTDRSLRQERGISREAFKGHNSQGRTIGIVGIGNVGKRVAHICGQGLGMKVLAYDPYLTAEAIESRGASPVGLDTLLAQADYVTVHCPLNAETRGLISQREIALMQSTAYLITTARGGIVDEDALAGALSENRIAGAGVDVWEVEPPPLGHRLLEFDNVIATYHTAGVTVDSRVTMAEWNAEQLVDIFSGKRPPRLVNPEAWTKYTERFEAEFGFRPTE